MQEPVQPLAALPGINPCTFCFYVPKTISPFTPPHIWKPLRNTRHSQRRAETLIIPSRYRQRLVQPRTHGQECERSPRQQLIARLPLEKVEFAFGAGRKLLGWDLQGARNGHGGTTESFGLEKSSRIPKCNPNPPRYAHSPRCHVSLVPEHLHGQLCQRIPTHLQSYPIAERAVRGWVGFLYWFFNNRIAGWLTYGIGQQNGEMLTSGGQKGRNGAVGKGKYFLL